MAHVDFWRRHKGWEWGWGCYSLGKEKGGDKKGLRLLSAWQGRVPCEGENRDRGSLSVGFIKWNMKGNIEPEGAFLITFL